MLIFINHFLSGLFGAYKINTFWRVSQEDMIEVFDNKKYWCSLKCFFYVLWCTVRVYVCGNRDSFRMIQPTNLT